MEKSNHSVSYIIYHSLSSPIKELGSLKWIFIVLIITHMLIGALIPPLVTSDYERNLFYGNAFWEYGFKVYDMTPIQIDPNYQIGDPTSNLLSYPNTTYDYPTIQLLFWAGISILPLSNILGKWILSCFDIFNFFMIYHILRRKDERSKELEIPEKLLPLSYLFLSIPFSASEGQSTALTITFLLLSLGLHSKYKYWGYLSVGLGFHWKYVSVIVLPYLVIKDRGSMRDVIYGLIVIILSVLFLSFPLLFSDFILNYFGFFGRLGEYSGQSPSNNLLLFHICISSLLSTFILVIGFFNLFGVSISGKKVEISLNDLMERAYWIPFLILLSFLKIYSTAFPWYWMWFYPLIIIFPTKERRFYTKLLGITFVIGLIDFIDMTVGLMTFLGYFL
jgi:hypothetical protein